MTVQKFQLPVSGFTDGLNTEASALNILPSEMMEGTTNIELLQNGSVRPRKGIDFIGRSDAGGFLQTVRVSTFAAEGETEAPNALRIKLTAPNGNLVDRIIVDINNEFWVFNSTNIALKNIDSPLQTLARSKTHDAQKAHVMSFAQSGKRLFFAGLHSNPGFLQVAVDNTSLEIIYQDVLVRDPAATAANTVKKVGTAWYECIETHTSNTVDNKPGSGVNWERYWFQKGGAAPGAVGAWANATAYTANIIKLYNKLTTPGATDTFPAAVSFYAGRLWLSGDPKNPNDTLFTQVVVETRDLEKFLQEADPFDATDPDLVDDDGGVLGIQGAGLIYQSVAIGDSIFFGSNTGVWQIIGADGIFKATNFSNNKVLQDGINGRHSMVGIDDEFIVFAQYSIWKSTVNTSIVSTQAGLAAFKPISEERIQARYAAISQADKAGAKAIYNKSERRVYYFHNRTRTNFTKSFGHDNEPSYFTTALIVDTCFKEDILETRQDPQNIERRVNGAFFEYSWADNADDEKPYIAAPFISEDIPANDETVIIGSDTVEVNGVTVVIAGNAEATEVVLSLILQRVTVGSVVTINSAFATLNTNNLKDFASSATYELFYTSKIITGLQTMGNVQPKKSVLYLYFVFEKVESGVLDSNGRDTTPGGCFLTTSWNWSTALDHPKTSSDENVVVGPDFILVDGEDVIVGPSTQIYFGTRFSYSRAGAGDDNESHVYRKHRVRGRGNTLRLEFQNERGKDFHLIGWTEQFYGGRT